LFTSVWFPGMGVPTGGSSFGCEVDGIDMCTPWACLIGKMRLA
jgi:hypothetical protein